VTDRWALADLRATAIMDATRTGAVAERNGRRLAEAASLSAAKTGLAVQAREPASPGAQEHDGQLAREHGSTSPDGLLCLEFTVPTAPRGWQEPNPIGYGRAVKPAGERAYQADIAKFARQARAAIGGMPLLRGGVRLAVIAYLAVPKSYGKAKRADCLAGRILPIVKPDFDNIAKSVADALTGVLWVDDKQVVAGSCLKMWAETPSLYVRVQAL
jgi:Holliday junction resolvase RusA-like endonuclease